MFDTLYSQIGAGVMLLMGGFAFWKGDQPERIGAGAYLLAWMASLLIQDDSSMIDWRFGVFAIDLVVAGVFAGLSWKADRGWSIWAAAFALLAVVSHLIRFFEDRASLFSFLTVQALASYGIVIAIIVGTFWAWQERRAAGLE